MSRSPFPSLRVAGGLLPADLFTRVLEDKDLPGRESAAYGLAPHENVREAASRAWDRLSGVWKAFVRERDRAVVEGRPLTGLTRERWLLILFHELNYGYGALVTTSAGGLTVKGVEDKTFKVSHCWMHVPIHLLGWAVDLDHRTKGVAGAADAAPQSMLQELLNRSSDHLWAILSNGAKLRLIRDSRSLAGSAYVEFDLELIFGEQLFSDFMLLFRLVHASRFAVQPDEHPSSCWLEKWRSTVIQQGERVKERLRGGVEQAINTLGTGFLRHPANSALREQLASGTLKLKDYQRSVLRLVYRMLFWMVTEDRDVLLDPSAPAAARERYLRFFSAERLRERARRGGADHHDDLWETVRLVFTALGTESGLPELALPGIGGLFERITRDESGEPLDPSRPDELDEPLEGLRLTNQALITAVRHLAIAETGDQRRPVDFRNLGSEELGSVYESLLELHPRYDPAEQTYTLTTAAGNERKTTGSYYTPPSLTGALLDSTLNPLLDEAARTADDAAAKVEALLSITVCDPACGSGHFLVAAARRIARRVAEIRSGEDEPSPDLVRTAMREVVARCIHGVDINEMAAELAKVSLWLESVEPGKPLAFLDTNIRVGNALLGVTPALIEKGIPKDAFKPIEGDDKKIATLIAKKNAKETLGIFDFYAAGLLTNAEIGRETAELVRALPGDLTGALVQRRRLRDIDAGRLPLKRKADAWCAAFVQEKTPETEPLAITGSTLDWISGDPSEWTSHHKAVAKRVENLTEGYRFFHWHVEFPHIFAVPEDSTDADPATGWRGGFTCVIGNPPWERVKLQEKEFFAARNEDIANARNAAARKKAIAALATSEDEADRRLFAEFAGELRKAEGWSHLLRVSGRYPLTGRGDINTYAVFAETGRTVLSPRGRVGMVLPTGIATDATTQYFFKDLVTTKTLASLYDFENEEKLFPNVHHSFRFCLWTGSGHHAPQDRINLAFRLRQVPQLTDRRFVLTPEDITLLNPNTGTCPVFDFKQNADITLRIYRRMPVLWREEPEDNPWGLSFMAMLHMANDSGLFHDRQQLEDDGWELDGNVFIRDGQRMLPLIEAKMIHHFDHRLGTYEGQTQAQANMGTLPRPTPEQKNDPAFAALPRYWVAEKEVEARLCPETDAESSRRYRQWDKKWLLGWRDICRSSDTRTVISSAIPLSAVGDKYLLALAPHGAALLQANLTSFVLDYCARQKIVGTSLKYFLFKQLPALPPEAYEESAPWQPDERLSAWVTARALELSYTSYDMESFARDHGDNGPPYRWDEERRFWLRAELDAAYFHLYGVARDDVDYVMDTFRAFKNNDPDRFARTKKAILEIYDAMADAITGRRPYVTVLDPAPGHGPRHPARTDA
ncbi:N-6 DNA methylase [Planomonospora alba]|uniref:site-specific DNA-methyltransferase (adenine-specific) n=1 Tax=Planomonospora alba TaxID=161354 RepID=A0ABP6MMZ5_9ACTN